MAEMTKDDIERFRNDLWEGDMDADAETNRVCDLALDGLRLRATLEKGPIAYRVHRDTDYNSREYFHTEEKALANACLGVVDTHITKLYTILEAK